MNDFIHLQVYNYIKTPLALLARPWSKSLEGKGASVPLDYRAAFSLP